MLEKVVDLVLIFMLYSILGWIMEVIVTFVRKKKFVNRGFLIGPYCPIYGWGALLIILFLNRYKSEPIELFLMAMFICSVLEYFTSYFMEKIFKTRWWDYSDKKFNINGRICLDTLIPFGLLGCLVIYVINPLHASFIASLPSLARYIISGLFVIVFLIDNAISQKLIFGFRNTVKNVEKDATEEITKKVKEILSKKGYIFKRFIEAYPNMKTGRERLEDLKKKINKEIDKWDNHVKRVKEKVSKRM